MSTMDSPRDFELSEAKGKCEAPVQKHGVNEYPYSDLLQTILNQKSYNMIIIIHCEKSCILVHYKRVV